MPDSPQDPPSEGDDPLIDEIIAMQDRLATLQEQEKHSRKKVSRAAMISNRALLYIFLGPRLTYRLGKLLRVAKEKNEPILGSTLAKVLDSASRRMTGYKRWAVLFGLIAAIPGMISVKLLWDQNKVVKRETQNTIADAENRERLDALLTIYSTEEKDPNGTQITPSYPAMLRAEAALKLIKLDTKSYQQIYENHQDPVFWRVDLSRAPLAKVNFSKPSPNATRDLTNISFTGSNLYKTSFERCQLSDCWFDSANIAQANFNGATLTRCRFHCTMLSNIDFSNTTFEDCDLKGAKYDQHTRWPTGFDPKAAGATRINTGQQGDAL